MEPRRGFWRRRCLLGSGQSVLERRFLAEPKPGPNSGGRHVVLRSGFDLALVEEPDGLLVKLLLATGVLTALEAFFLVVVGLLLHHEIAANLQSRSPDKRLHVAARLWVTGVQHPGKNLITQERADEERERANRLEKELREARQPW